jgi:hypothetical protein
MASIMKSESTRSESCLNLDVIDEQPRGIRDHLCRLMSEKTGVPLNAVLLTNGERQ